MASDSPSDSRQRRASMPMNALSGSSQKQSQSRLAEQRTPSRSKIGMLGTIKKRLSVFGNDSRSSETPSPASVSPVRSTLVPHAPPSPLPSRDDEPVVVIDSREHSTSNAYGEQVGVWAAVSGNNPESNGDVTATEVPSTMTPMQANRLCRSYRQYSLATRSVVHLFGPRLELPRCLRYLSSVQD